MYAEGTAFNVQLLTALSLDSLNLLSQPFRGAVSEDVLGRAALCSLRPRTKRPGGTPKPQDKGTLPGGQSPARSHRLQPRQPALPPVSSAQSRRRPAGARPGALLPPLPVPQRWRCRRAPQSRGAGRARGQRAARTPVAPLATTSRPAPAEARPRRRGQRPRGTEAPSRAEMPRAERRCPGRPDRTDRPAGPLPAAGVCRGSPAKPSCGSGLPAVPPRPPPARCTGHLTTAAHSRRCPLRSARLRSAPPRCATAPHRPDITARQ